MDAAFRLEYCNEKAKRFQMTHDSTARSSIDGSVHEHETGGGMADKVDELASDVDDALVSADELENDPGTIKSKEIAKVKHALEKAKDKIDEMEDADD